MLRFLILNGHGTGEFARKLFEMCVDKVESGGRVVMYFPKELGENANFLGVNFRSVEVGVVELFNERGLGGRVLVAGDRESFDRLLNALGERACGITFLESFAKYVEVAKKGNRNRKMMRALQGKIIVDLLKQSNDVFFLWQDYEFTYNNRVRRRTYLYDTIKDMGQIIHF